MMHALFGAKMFFDPEDFPKLVLRLALDLLFVALVVRGVYVRVHRRRDYVFTYYLFNIITFSMCFLLRKVPIEMGFALGLFAVFGVLRYRTEAIRIRDLTYLFVVIGIALLNALSNKRISVAELLLVNGVIVAATWALERSPWAGREVGKPVRYDRLELLAADQRQALHDDLRQRTGLPVRRVTVDRVDLLRDTADLTVFYDPGPDQDA